MSANGFAESEPPGPGIAVLDRATLAEAVAAVAESWRTGSTGMHDLHDARAHLDALADAIIEGRVKDRPGLSPAALVLRRRLLELLRAEVVRSWADSAGHRDTAEIVAVLSAFECVREQLDSGWGDTLPAWMIGPDGVSMLTEVAHDLRSPLTSILFLSDALRRGQSGEVSDLQQRQLGIIYSAALGLLSTMGDVIELAQGGDRLADSQPTPFSVREVLGSVHDMVLPIAEVKGLSLRILPPDGDYRRGFPVALSRVLLNLASNALKFTEKGMVEIVAMSRYGDRIEFSVRDTGDGIAPEAVPALFSVFRRDTGRRTPRFSGSGLGLSICRTLVQAMGSELQMETRPGWGTRFYFELELPRAEPI
ncbi:MAG TPA: HAMP domain-containing sensor histidine kinase [Longimicrobiales bacterium]|nr:HAMP domain-containing sensor histidine kinase [Longimicrobiales bacterium]